MKNNANKRWLEYILKLIDIRIDETKVRLDFTNNAFLAIIGLTFSAFLVTLTLSLTVSIELFSLTKMFLVMISIFFIVYLVVYLVYYKKLLNMNEDKITYLKQLHNIK